MAICKQSEAESAEQSPILVSPRRLAQLSGWSVKRIRVLITQNQLHHIHVGQSVLLPADAIERFVAINMFTPMATNGERMTK